MIRQFDVFPNPIRIGKEDKPYLVSIQHYFLDHLNSRIMAPLVTRRAVQDQPRLYPAMTVLDRVLYFDPTDLSTIPIRFLRTAVANLSPESLRITAALDLVFTGV